MNEKMKQILKNHYTSKAVMLIVDAGSQNMANFWSNATLQTAIAEKSWETA